MAHISDCIVINNVLIPAPDADFEIIESTTVNAGRNANNAVVGQVVGRSIWKLNNLSWSNLAPEEWKIIKDALEPFFVTVGFTDDTNIRRNIIMYPGDRTGKPMRYKDLTYARLKTGKVNLIDAGW